MRERTQLAVQRNDFKLEQLPPHLLMNFRVVDEHGRQLGSGRHLANLKAELGGLARTAFQALAALKLPAATPRPAEADAPLRPVRGVKADAAAGPAAPADTLRYTAWSFGELPELMEIRRGAQTLVGFPALVDKGDGVEIEVFDEPDGSGRQAPCRAAPAGGAADQGAAEAPGKEHP